MIKQKLGPMRIDAVGERIFVYIELQIFHEYHVNAVREGKKALEKFFNDDKNSRCHATTSHLWFLYSRSSAQRGAL